MGYTHYWELPKKLTEEDREGMELAVPIVRKILERHANLVCFEANQPDDDPEVSKDRIRFNGKGDDGHETFLFNFRESTSDFCKTNRRPYDIVICEVLLVLNALIPNLSIRSDGWEEGFIEMEWRKAMGEVMFYGICYDQHKGPQAKVCAHCANERRPVTNVYRESEDE